MRFLPGFCCIFIGFALVQFLPHSRFCLVFVLVTIFLLVMMPFLVSFGIKYGSLVILVFLTITLFLSSSHYRRRPLPSVFCSVCNNVLAFWIVFSLFGWPMAGFWSTVTFIYIPLSLLLSLLSTVFFVLCFVARCA